MIKISILLFTALTLFANHPYIYSADFQWNYNGHIIKNNSIINDDNVSYSWKVWFNSEFTKAYDGKTVQLTEVYEAEYGCWDKNILQEGQLSDDNLTYTRSEKFIINRYSTNPVNKEYQYNGYWYVGTITYDEYDKEACKAFNKYISHDKIHVYANDILLHTFEFTITPKDYNKSVEYQQKEETKEKSKEYKLYIPPNYAKIYLNTPQIVLPKVHIYDVKKLSYFRNKKEIIFIKAGSGNYAIPKKELKEAKYLFLTEALQKRLVALGIDRTHK